VHLRSIMLYFAVYPATYEEFVNTPIPTAGMERQFFLEMRAYFLELVKQQKSYVIDIPANDAQRSGGNKQTLQEALQQRNANIDGQTQFRKTPNVRLKKLQARNCREASKPGAAFA